MRAQRRSRRHSTRYPRRPSWSRQGTAFVVLLAVLAAAAALFRPAPAQAGPVRLRFPVRLEYIRGPGAEHCPGEEFLRAEMRRQLKGMDPFPPDASHTVTATVRRDGAELVGVMQLRDATGKILWVDGFGFDSSEPCAVLVSAMAVTIVVEIQTVRWAKAGEGEAAEPAAPASPPPVPSAMPAPAPPPPPKMRRATAPRRGGSPPASTRRLWLEGGASAVMAFGITPGAAGGMALSIAARSSGWSLGLEARALGAFSQEVDLAPIATSLFTAAAVGCLYHGVLFACGLAEVGAYRFATEALGDISPRDGPLVALAARGGAEVSFSARFSVRGYVDVVEPIRAKALQRHPHGRPTPDRTLWASPPVGIALGLNFTATY